jgi:hypothetical protein
VSYDVVNADEARALAQQEPLSFLHVTRSEVDLPDTLSPYDAQVYARAAHNLRQLTSLAPLVRDHPLVLQIVRSHHERQDGAGLPDSLRGDAIPLVARVTAVADSFDAMTSTRPYRSPRAPGEAIAELRASAGTQLDADAVAGFMCAFPDPALLPLATPGQVGALHEAALAALAR